MTRILTVGLCLCCAIMLGADKPQEKGGKNPPPPAPVEDAPTQFAHPELLQPAATLVKEFKAGANIVVLDARDEPRYQAGHIPGAFNVPSDYFQDPEHGPTYLATADVVKKLCAASGINAESRVVVYDEDDGRLAARVWFTLFAYGHEHGSILSGGLSAWREAKGAIASDRPPAAATAGTFEPSETLRGVCTFDELPQFRQRVQALGKLPPTTLLDARSVKEYMGDDLRGSIGGHIPGAANIEWSALMVGAERSRTWRTPAEIFAMLKLAGVDKEQKIAVYDQAGGRSSHLFFTLSMMGFKEIHNFTGGWREYSKHPDVEIEK